MRIYKLAQSGGDYLDVDITFENGEVKIVVENGPTLTCKDVPSNEVLDKLLGKAAEGFGAPLMTKMDSGKTGEYYEEQRQESQEEHVVQEKPTQQQIRGPQVKERQQLEL